jgi:cytochrome c551/c552
MKPSLFLAPLLASALSAADTPAQVFQIQCSACHAVDQMLVGPSLVEIAGIYQGKPDDFVKWCITPQHKREEVIEMPSMAHLGAPVLRELHGYVLQAAQGKTELKKTGGDPYSVPSAMVRRPQVQRIFLPDASPAAIAVALPGDLSYCFDAAECRLRYVWKGGFIDGADYWKGNGSSLAKLGGKVVYREEKFPISHAVDSAKGDRVPVKFLGYTVSKTGIPTFRYEKHGLKLAETIEPLADGSGITRRFEFGLNHSVFITPPSGVSVTCSSGLEENGILVPEFGKPFTLTYRWK